MWEGPLRPDGLRRHNGSGRKGPSHIAGLQAFAGFITNPATRPTQKKPTT